VTKDKWLPVKRREPCFVRLVRKLRLPLTGSDIERERKCFGVHLREAGNHGVGIRFCEQLVVTREVEGFLDHLPEAFGGLLRRKRFATTICRGRRLRQLEFRHDAERFIFVRFQCELSGNEGRANMVERQVEVEFPRRILNRFRVRRDRDVLVDVVIGRATRDEQFFADRAESQRDSVFPGNWIAFRVHRVQFGLLNLLQHPAPFAANLDVVSCRCTVPRTARTGFAPVLTADR